MAIVNQRGAFVLQGVTVTSIPAGRAVVIAASGSGTKELPSVQLAPANSTQVFVATVPPDNFPKPARERFYRYPDSAFSSPEMATSASGLMEEERMYKYSPSLAYNFTIPSGWPVQLHRGCVVTVFSGAFNDTPSIRVAGANVAVSANGVWTQSDTNAVGTVVMYKPGELTFVLR